VIRCVRVLCDFSSVDEHIITQKIHTSVRVHAFIGSFINMYVFSFILSALPASTVPVTFSLAGLVFWECVDNISPSL